LKTVIKKLFNNRVLPVMSNSLRGTRLRVNGLVKGSVFIHDYEPDKQNAFRFLLRDNSIFFDVGANVGLHSYYVTRRFPNVKITAFEPLPGNAAYIRESIALNKFTNIQVVESAVSSSEGEAFFDENKNNSMGMLVARQTSLKVKLITLDNFVRAHHVFPDVLKIDVEGAESEVLKGAAYLIQQAMPSFIIELHNPRQDLEVAQLLLAQGYAIFRLNEKATRMDAGILLPILKPNKPWPDPEGVWGNLVAIHSSKLNQFIQQ
jgi:FkbM family methyltransferase